MLLLEISTWIRLSCLIITCIKPRDFNSVCLRSLYRYLKSAKIQEVSFNFGPSIQPIQSKLLRRVMLQKLVRLHWNVVSQFDNLDPMLNFIKSSLLKNCKILPLILRISFVSEIWNYFPFVTNPCKRRSFDVTPQLLIFCL